MRKLFISLIMIAVLIIMMLLKPFQEKIVTKNITITSAQKTSKLDAILLPHLEKIKNNSTLITAISRPSKNIRINNLWVDKIEVKQGDFYKFIAWSRINNTRQFFAKTQDQNWKFYSSSKSNSLSGKLDVASNGISFFDAFSYCAASSGRLATDDEFSLIAGEDLYPWGNEFNASPWVYYDPLLNATLKPGSFINNNTKEGVMDLGSSLSEWTIGDYPQGLPSIRGGNAYSKPHQIYALNTFYQKLEPDYRSPYIGFRCVYDKKPQSTTLWKSKINAIHLQNKNIKTNHHPYSKILPILKFLPQIGITKFNSLLTTGHKNKYNLKVAVNEVSVYQYAQFLNDVLVKTNIYAHPEQPEQHNLMPLNWQKQQQHQQRAVVGVDFWSAYHFANWAGGRLPNYDEMIKIYALGGNQQSTFKENKQMHPTQLQSSTGIENLTGNVSEWTTSINTSKQKLSMIVYGGSFLIEEKRARNINFYRSINPNSRLLDVGIRMVFD